MCYCRGYVFFFWFGETRGMRQMGHVRSGFVMRMLLGSVGFLVWFS